MVAATQYKLVAADLEVLLALARAGKLAQAGERLGVDASTVFRSLQRIERGLGVTLFERSRNGYAPTELALTLAHAKAQVVAERVGPGALVIGCDSVLDLDGVAYGKPANAEEAVSRWRDMRGKNGMLLTGHCLIDTREPVAEPAEGQSAEKAAGRDGGAGMRSSVHIDVGATLVRFADLSDEEIDAYVATGEPLHVAGAFTLDGLGGSFVESIAGDPSNVIGLSLPLLRRLLAEAGVGVPDLWAR